jgi:hypothetical protein
MACCVTVGPGAAIRSPECSCVLAKCANAACMVEWRPGKEAATSGRPTRSCSRAGPKPRTSAPAAHVWEAVMFVTWASA